MRNIWYADSQLGCCKLMFLQDTSFSGSPVQCDPETCKVMEKMIKFADTMGLDESYQVCSVLFFGDVV